MHKRPCTLAICLLLSVAGKARGFNPTVSLLSTYTATQNGFQSISGAYNLNNQKRSIGLELSHKFYLHQNVFFKTGFRYNRYSVTVNGVNTLPGLAENSYPLIWLREYESFSVPLLLGKDFEWGTRRGDFFVGFSAGGLAFSTLGIGSSLRPKTGSTDTSAMSAEIRDTNASQFPICFFPTLDFGGAVQPFKSLPALRVGAQCAIQLNRTQPYNYSGTVTDLTKGETFDYRFQMAPRFTNISLFVSYTFGKQREFKRKVDKFACPVL